MTQSDLACLRQTLLQAVQAAECGNARMMRAHRASGLTEAQAVEAAATWRRTQVPADIRDMAARLMSLFAPVDQAENATVAPAAPGFCQRLSELSSRVWR